VVPGTGRPLTFGDVAAIIPHLDKRVWPPVEAVTQVFTPIELETVAANRQVLTKLAEEDWVGELDAALAKPCDDQAMRRDKAIEQSTELVRFVRLEGCDQNIPAAVRWSGFGRFATVWRKPSWRTFINRRN
jgi:hypothetical protein